MNQNVTHPLPIKETQTKNVFSSCYLVTQALYAFGDEKSPLPETIRVLDEILTDYVIDTVQTAAKVATVSGRGKVKADDFKFAIRHDEIATGRVKELLAEEKYQKAAKKTLDLDKGEGKTGLERSGRGRKKKVNEESLKGEVKRRGKKKSGDEMKMEEDLMNEDMV